MSYNILMSILGDIFSGITGAIGTGYNLYTNKRDFDYQKSLQQEIFQREDTAVQRRKNDLLAAGFNPALAMGQSAGAGSVVSRSNTNDANFGSAIDFINAARQAKGLKIANETAQNERDISAYEKMAAKYEANLRKHQALAQMGITTVPYISQGGDIKQAVTSKFAGEHDYGLQDSPVLSEWTARVKEAEWTDQKHSNELQSLFLRGNEILNTQQKLNLEMLKFQWQQQTDSFYIKQAELNNEVDRICKSLGKENESERVKNELNRLDWEKEKWTYEMLSSTIQGLIDSFIPG